MHRESFTLIEILIVIVIVAILASLSLPVFLKTLEKAKVGEAISNLDFIRAAQKGYFLAYGTFSSDISSLGIENPNQRDSRYFNYTIQSSNSSDFIANATRGTGGAIDAPSPYQGVVYYISKDGRITSSDGMFLPTK